MIIMAEKDDYFCALLEEGDFEVFKRVHMTCYADKEPPEISYQNKRYIIEKAQEDNGEFWRDAFQNPSYTSFSLFRKNKKDFDVVGESFLFTVDTHNKDKKVTTISGLHILTPYRNKKLTDLLYRSMLKHAADTEPTITDINLFIHTYNKRSLSAALRNGFSFYKEGYADGGKGAWLARPLDDLRAPEPAFCYPCENWNP